MGLYFPSFALFLLDFNMKAMQALKYKLEEFSIFFSTPGIVKPTLELPIFK